MTIARRMPALAMLAIATLALATWFTVLPQEFPALQEVQLCSHAIERHGEDARKARKRLFDCKPRNFRAKLCPPGSKYGTSVVFWCQPQGATICPGMYVTIGGIEKTAFMRPCTQWENCQ